MINGFEYAWEDIQIKWPYLATAIEGALEIRYKKTREHKNIYGRGSDPVAMGRGRKGYEGSMKVLQSVLSAFQQSLPPGKDITDVVIPVITVSYAPEAGVAETDNLFNVRINEFEKGMAEGDANMEIDLPLTIGKILYNV